MKNLLLIGIIGLLFETTYSQTVNLAYEVRDTTNGRVQHVVSTSKGLFFSGAFHDTVYVVCKPIIGCLTSTHYDNGVYLYNPTLKKDSLWDMNKTYVDELPMGTGAKDFFVFNDEPHFYAHNGTSWGTYKIDKNTNDTVRLLDYGIGKPVIKGDSILFLDSQSQYRPIMYWDGVNTPVQLPNQQSILNYGGFIPLGNMFLVSGEIIDGTGNPINPDIGAELLLYDPATGPTLLANTNTEAGQDGPINYLTKVADKVFFRGNNQLWISDGTPGGTNIVNTVMDSISNSVHLSEFYGWNDKLIFSAKDNSGSGITHLFLYNLTLDTLIRLKYNDTGHINFGPSYITPLNGELYFGLPDKNHYTTVLHKTDGTPEGTIRLDSIIRGPSNLTVFDGKLYMAGQHPTGTVLSGGTITGTGIELLVYDPTNTLANVATLSDISTNENTIAGFNSLKLNYEYLLEAGDQNVPEITATATDSKATIVNNPATTIPGKTTFIVTAEDGVHQHTYSVSFRNKSRDASLDSILTYYQGEEEVPLESFEATTYYYEQVLDATTLVPPKLRVVTNDINASALVQNANMLPDTSFVNVTAEDGNTKATYKVFFRNVSDNAELQAIIFGEDTLQIFEPTIYEYNILLESSATEIPLVKAIPADSNATISISDGSILPDTITIVVTAEDGKTEETYTLNFRNISIDATLAYLTVDNVPITDFDPAVTSYTVDLAEGTTIVPVIHGESNDTNATIVINETNSLPGTSEITVTAEDMSTKITYSVNFNVLVTNTFTSKADDIYVFPTISSGKFIVETDKLPAQIDIYDIHGQLIFSKTQTDSKVEIDIEKSGIYVLKVNNKKFSKTFRLIKK